MKASTFAFALPIFRVLAVLFMVIGAGMFISGFYVFTYGWAYFWPAAVLMVTGVMGLKISIGMLKRTLP